MRIAVTGSNGFLGSALVHHLRNNGHEVQPLGRDKLSDPDLEGVDTLIHCAALAHLTGKSAPSPEAFQSVNGDLPVRLAFAAQRAGVKRFVFVSTINVVAGNKGPLVPSMAINPLSEYGLSKASAEVGLKGVPGIEVVIARPALVYGPKAPGNMRALTKLCKLPVPLPLGSASNQRSFLSITNAVRALEFLATAPSSGVSGRTFHLADPVPLSTADLVKTIRRALGRGPALVPVPPGLIRSALRLAKRGAMADQLFGDMVVSVDDIERAGFAFEDGHRDLEGMARAA